MPLTTDPASPPQTPIKVTQTGYRKQSRNRPGKKNRATRPRPTIVQQSADANGQQQPYSKIAKTVPFRPHQFRPDELSPRSSDSSGMMEDCRIDDDDADERAENDSDNRNGDEDVNDDDDDDHNGDNGDDDIALQFESGSCSSPGDNLPQLACPVGIPRSQASPRTTPLQPQSEHDSGSASPTSPYASDEGIKNIPSEAENSSVASSPSMIEATIVIEELFDFDSDGGLIEVLLPDSIEEPESEHEASPTASATNPHRRGTLHFGKGRRRLSSMRSVRPPDIDRSVMSGLRGFSFRTVSDEEVVLDDNDEEDNSDFDEESYNQFRLKQREERRRRRMTSGSIGKRTITESIGSDTDNEDLRSQVDISEVGSSARRMRRRIGDRTSLQFSDPPPPRIDELDEPDTATDNDDDDDEDDIRELIEDGESLARELPYYTLEFISMEVDSP